MNGENVPKWEAAVTEAAAALVPCLAALAKDLADLLPAMRETVDAFGLIAQSVSRP